MSVILTAGELERIRNRAADAIAHPADRRLLLKALERVQGAAELAITYIEDSAPLTARDRLRQALLDTGGK